VGSKCKEKSRFPDRRLSQFASPEKTIEQAISKKADSLPDNRVAGNTAEFVQFQEKCSDTRQKMDEVHRTAKPR